MFGFLMDPKFEKAQRERMKREREERLAKGGVPWDLKMKWVHRLTIQASTWPSWDLFPCVATAHHNPNHEKDESKHVLSPSGQFMYCKKLLRRGEMLATMNRSTQGDVMFDADVEIPALHERTKGWRAEHGEVWCEKPWMSITPNELLTQRPGLRFAKGHTIVAGLGLGWALAMIRLKKSVKHVTLVERSQELVDWVLPRAMDVAKLHHGEKMASLDVVVGDAYDVIPKMKADVAVIDIFDGYGSNDFLDDLRYSHRGGTLLPEERSCSGIGRIWCWGSAKISEERGWGW